MRVVAQQQVRVLFPNDAGQSRGGFVQVRTDEPRAIWRIREQDRPVPAVGVPQVPDPMDAKRGRAGRASTFRLTCSEVMWPSASSGASSTAILGVTRRPTSLSRC